MSNITSITTDPSLRKVSIETAWALQYGQGVVSPPFVFISGCLGLDPKTGNLVEGGVEAQTRQALPNLRGIRVVEAGGSQVGKIVKTTVFVKDMNDFGAINAIYVNVTTRSLVEVPRIPRDALIVVEAIASVTLT